MTAPGDQLVSFGGYTFDSAMTVKMEYPLAVRPVLSEMPGVGYAIDQYGTGASPTEATDLTATYHLQAASNAALKTALQALIVAMEASGVGPLITSERDGTGRTCQAVYQSCALDVGGSDILDQDITLIWTPLTPIVAYP